MEKSVRELRDRDLRRRFSPKTRSFPQDGRHLLRALAACQARALRSLAEQFFPPPQVPPVHPRVTNTTDALSSLASLLPFILRVHPVRSCHDAVRFLQREVFRDLPKHVCQCLQAFGASPVARTFRSSTHVFVASLSQVCRNQMPSNHVNFCDVCSARRGCLRTIISSP